MTATVIRAAAWFQADAAGREMCVVSFNGK